MSRAGSLICLMLSHHPTLPSLLLHERLLAWYCSRQPHTDVAILVHFQIRWAAVWACLTTEGERRKMNTLICPVYQRHIAKPQPQSTGSVLCANKQAIQELLCCDLQGAATSAFSILTWKPVWGTSQGQVMPGPEAIISSGKALSQKFNFIPSVLR